MYYYIDMLTCAVLAFCRRATYHRIGLEFGPQAYVCCGGIHNLTGVAEKL